MPRWNNSLENNCRDLLDNNIKNVNPILYRHLLEEVLDSKLENNKKLLEIFFRRKLNIPRSLSKQSVGYWTARGWADSESYVKAKAHKHQNSVSVFNSQTWLNKINPVTKTYYSVTEADFERNSRRPIRPEYWIAKGYCTDDAHILALNTKDQNNRSGANKAAESNIRRIVSIRCVEYFTARGHSLSDAILLVSKNQKYFSKEICIEKYGELEGITIWQSRQTNWQATLNSKSPEEKARINRAKLSKGVTVSKAEKIILEAIRIIVPEVIHQFTVCTKNKKQYVYDIMANKKIIEYNGDFWHANPLLYSDDYINPRSKIKAIDKWESDRVKLQYARDNGYMVLVVWESDFKKNKEKVINQCIQFLTQ